MISQSIDANAEQFAPPNFGERSRWLCISTFTPLPSWVSFALALEIRDYRETNVFNDAPVPQRSHLCS